MRRERRSGPMLGFRLRPFAEAPGGVLFAIRVFEVVDMLKHIGDDFDLRRGVGSGCFQPFAKLRNPARLLKDLTAGESE